MSLDPRAHTECLEFIRAAIATDDPQTAREVASVVKEVYQSGHANRTQIWADLTPIERQQFQSLLVPPPLACEAGQKNQRGDQLQLARCGLRHRERVE